MIKDGYYWFKSERATNNAIAQYLNGKWYLIGEVLPVTLDDLEHRGWYLLRKAR